MKQPSIKDISQHSGVSTATVDRVLHGRSGVSRLSREKVAKSIHALQFRSLPDGLLVRGRPEIRFKFILPNVYTTFSAQILKGVVDAPSAVEDMTIINDVQHIDLDMPQAIVDALDGVDASIYAGAALFAVDAPGVRAAIDRLVERGVKVVSIVTDIADSKRHHFVGIDNAAAGRLGATLMGRFTAGKVGKIGVILGSTRMRDQYERLLSFSEVIATRFPSLRILPIVEGYSKAELNYSLTRKLVSRHYDLVGIYAVPAGQSGILNALKDEGVGDRLTVILHELSDRVAFELKQGTVDACIAQSPGHVARSAVRVLKACCLGTPINASQEFIRTDIYLADNIPILS
ncbi:LacI family DNA-binding transcriptional regulator [Rhizobium leguminosarum]|uniref:LacI family DNA-binding transcriptional regulator n=1 Tax=Rhizobium leguminosarum TaxID=384 RepID=UPI0013B43DDF|nr:LacI family DNA-binding transcriptional regulator [Rhizobium leguminosarum]MBY5502414.1 LacI family DNA-binding transcriptional regulator [Rhizobium leguminosarum]